MITDSHGRRARSSSPSRDELSQFLVRLRRSYNAIRSALDYFLPVQWADSSSVTVRSPWLLRVWWEITLTSYATGILVADRTLGQAQSDSHRLVSDYLLWLNQRAMLVTHHEFARPLDKFKPPEPDGDLLQLGPGFDEEESALDRRWRVLKLAKSLTAAGG
jgi:hypothetical protein